MGVCFSVYSFCDCLICIISFVRYSPFIMGTKSQDVSITIEPEGEKEVDKLAKAVNLVRRSGLFNVDPVDRYAVGGEFVPPTRRNVNDSKSCSSPSNLPPYGIAASRGGFLDAHVFPSPPRLSTFSGGVAKTDVSFEAWLFEVKCLIKDGLYPKDLITLGVRRSLKGEAGKLVMHLGEDATVDEILRKLERVYGVVESGAAILQRFYNSHQEDGESVAAYGCRLEDTISSAIDRGIVSRHQADEMLRNKFWSGLKDERVKNVIRQGLQYLQMSL